MNQIVKSERKPWGWHTRYRGHKEDEPVHVPQFLRRGPSKPKPTGEIDVQESKARVTTGEHNG